LAFKGVVAIQTAAADFLFETVDLKSTRRQEKRLELRSVTALWKEPGK
jgi:hypothetical protein